MWILIDGNNWFARDFFANAPGAMATFVKRLNDVGDDRKPDRLTIAWDSHSSFRRDKTPSYKAGRGSKPDGFYKTLAELRRALDSMGIESIESTGYEADDLLASMAQTAVDEGEQAMIFSTDRDLHQCLVAGLINQITSVERVTRDQLRYVAVTAATLFEKYGVHPHQWIDYRALTGDASDGIKGCAGIGPKAARELLAACGSLDAFYVNPYTAPLTRRQHSLLINYRDLLPDVRDLLTLRTDAICTFTEAVK